jgi:hypothetical protein
MNMRKCLSLWMLVSLFGSAVAFAAPQPSIVPKGWELNFRYRDPERIAVTVPGRSEPVVYWYMLYTVENRTDEARGFYPTFTIVTDTLNVVESEIGVSPEAFRAIKRRWADPLLLAASQINGKLLVGEDRAKRGVAIWPDFDPKAREFTVYVTGLSGETTRIANPAFDAEKPVGPQNLRFFILHKTLEIPYRLPGGTEGRSIAVPQRLNREPVWVMR